MYSRNPSPPPEYPLREEKYFPLSPSFTTVETRGTSIDWPANWTAAVYIQPKSSLLEHSVEYLSYDLNDVGFPLIFFRRIICQNYF